MRSKLLSDNLLSVDQLISLINSIELIDISKISSIQYYTQYNIIDQLYQQSHLHIALSQIDPSQSIDSTTSHTHNLLHLHQNNPQFNHEFIVQLLQNHDNNVHLNNIIFNLITNEYFNRSALLPISNTLQHSASDTHSTNTIKLYTCMYYENISVGLLCNLLYHSQVFNNVNECNLIELIDYCIRQITVLCTPQCAPATSSRTCNTALYNTMNEKWATIQYSISIQCITILRYITDNSTQLSTSCIHRLNDVHDLLVQSSVLLCCSKPWQRINDQHTEYYIDNQWIVVSTDANAIQLTDVELQLWLTVRNLLTSTQFISTYAYNQYRRNHVLQMNDVLTSELLKQLPILKDSKRNIESLHFVDVPGNTVQSNLPLIEVIAEHRQHLIDHTDIKQVINNTAQNYLSNNTHDDDMCILNQLYSNQTLYDLLDSPTCTVCGAAAEKRCSRCKLEWYCSRQCQVDNWVAHKPTCDLIYNDDLFQQQQKASQYGEVQSTSNTQSIEHKPLIQTINNNVTDQGITYNPMDEMD